MNYLELTDDGSYWLESLATSWIMIYPTLVKCSWMAQLYQVEPCFGKRLSVLSSSALDQLRSFSQAVHNFANPGQLALVDFTYANWNQA
jgi:hypothetical protein